MVADRYVVVASLGAGGMGEVLRARDPRLDREVALKVLPAQRIGDAVATARLLREARAAAALEHPNIVPVYDVGPTGDGGAYLAMQLVAGESLRDRLRAQGSLPLRDVRKIVGEVGAALAFAHDAGVVHRDVKPDNVMLREGDGAAVVLDFGLAKRVEKGDAATLTAEGAMVGTPAYLAPEQARGAPVDARADQFALGVMTYELLAGSLPFGGESVLAIVASLLKDEAPSLEGRGLPGGVVAAVARALSKAPEDRFEDVRGFVAALGAGDDDAALAATVEAPAAPAPAPRAPRAIPVPALAAAGVVAVALAGAFVWLREPGAAPGPTPDAGAPAPVTMLTAPPPRGCSAAALPIYDEAIRVLHGGNWSAGCDLVREAAAADPRCAAAQLRRLQCGYTVGDDAESRAAFQRANLYADDLSEPQRALLDAFEPLIAQSPPDRAEFLRRQARFPERFPDDAEMLHYAALMSSASDEARLRWGARATEIDPDYADAHQAQARLLIAHGREDEALARLRTCRERAPGATDCLGDEINLLRRRGQCEEALAGIPTFRARSGDVSWGSGMEASLRASLGQPDDAILPLAARARPDVGALLRAQLAAFRGRLDEVIAVVEGAGPPPSELTLVHRILETLAAEARLERGEADAAAALAQAAAAARERALASVRVVPEDIYWDLRMIEIAAPITPEARIVALRGRVRAAIERLERAGPLERWALEEASGVRDAADAERALRAIETPPETGSVPTLVFTARALALAGRHADAIARYRRVVRGCEQLAFPFLTMRAHVELGDALEASGDHAGACAAWRVVDARWGDTAPRSVTVRAAAERLSTCGATAAPP